MPRVSLNIKAPDFSLEDVNGNVFSLSDAFGKQNVILILNRGFI
jgi:peroxiredoxin